MNDYITRQEFEQAIESLRCYGDQQTINVTQTPGGQVVTSTQVISTEPSDATTEYIAVSYDSGTEKFTVTITDLPIINTNIPLGYVNAFTKYSQTFVFDKPTVIATIELYVGKDRDYENSLINNAIYWYSTAAVGSNAETLGLEITNRNTYTKIGTVVALFNGTYTLTQDIDPNSVLTIGDNSNLPLIKVDTTNKIIYLVGALTSGGAVSANTISYVEPFSDQVIVGFTNATTVFKFDSYANRATYDDYIIVGQVAIDASNYVNSAYYSWNPNSYIDQAFGYFSGTFTNGDGNTVTVVNGIITKIV